jgi:hypothetical protein
VSKDTLGTGFNQVKGLNLYGKFLDGKLHDVDIVKNAEVIFYMRNNENELIGINKNISSRINMILDNNAIETITFFNQVDGDIYPEADLPENARKLRGLVWRADERIFKKEDLFTDEENEYNDKMIEDGKKDNAAKNVPLKVRKETLNYDKKKAKSK